jgi:glutathione S-transferase
VSSRVAQLISAFGVPESQIAERAYLLGEDFTNADINLASTIREPGEQGVAGIGLIDLALFPTVERWLVHSLVSWRDAA